MGRRWIAASMLVGAVVVACGPIVMIPGGELSGTPAPVPESWDFTNEVDTIQLEARPEDPYSVNAWMVVYDGSPHVVAGEGLETTWARYLVEDPRLRLRVGEALYELRAVEANDEATRNGFLEAARVKYDFDPADRPVDQAIVFRLEPR
jgi:hypothetical protein